jgi:hypothetical protein
MSFQCTKCGLCCTRIDKILVSSPPWPWLRQMIAEFPYGAKENGHCEQFDADRAAAELDLGMSKFEWYRMNYEGCKILQDAAA